MYHKEEIINGVLCHKGTPDDEWEPYTLEALTIALTAERRQSESHRSVGLDALTKLEAIRGILDAS